MVEELGKKNGILRQRIMEQTDLNDDPFEPLDKEVPTKASTAFEPVFEHKQRQPFENVDDDFFDFEPLDKDVPIDPMADAIEAPLPDDVDDDDPVFTDFSKVVVIIRIHGAYAVEQDDSITQVSFPPKRIVTSIKSAEFGKPILADYNSCNRYPGGLRGLDEETIKSKLIEEFKQISNSPQQFRNPSQLINRKHARQLYHQMGRESYFRKYGTHQAVCVPTMYSKISFLNKLYTRNIKHEPEDSGIGIFLILYINGKIKVYNLFNSSVSDLLDDLDYDQRHYSEIVAMFETGKHVDCLETTHIFSLINILPPQYDNITILDDSCAIFFKVTRNPVNNVIQYRMKANDTLATTLYQQYFDDMISCKPSKVRGGKSQKRKRKRKNKRKTTKQRNLY
jgi:hypothetical protein